MIQYFLEVSIAWLVFYLLYILLFKKETFFEVNRWVLVSSLLLGMVLPLLRLLPSGIKSELSQIYAGQFSFESLLLTHDKTSVASILNDTITVSGILFTVYIAGILISLFRIGIGFKKIHALNEGSVIEKYDDYTLVITPKVRHPFSFLDKIYVNEDYRNSLYFDKILRHELTHVKYRHSYDVLMLQLLSVIFWWNPLIYMYRKEIKESHEFMADAIAKGDSDPKNYGHILLGQSSSGIELALAHHFFNSHLKNRINMLYQKRSARQKLLRYLSFIPCILILAAFFISQSAAAEISSSEAVEFNLTNKMQQMFKMESDTLKPTDGVPVFKVVEEMPRFPGCENLSDNHEKDQCSKKKLFEYILANLKYPEAAQKNNTEGKALIEFTVDTDGTLKDIVIKQDLADGCGAEAKRVVASMNNMKEKWIAGRQRGKAVKVQMVLPFQFKL